MTLEKNKREINSLLKKLYYDPVTGYTGVDPLVAATAVAGKKKIKRQVVTEWLAKQEPYALHKSGYHFRFPNNMYVRRSHLFDPFQTAILRRAYRRSTSAPGG